MFSTSTFSFVMISLTNDSAEKQAFIVLVNAMLAVFLPSPQIKDEKDEKWVFHEFYRNTHFKILPKTFCHEKQWIN